MGSKLKTERLGEERLNNQGCTMKIIEYINSNNIIIEFQDDYKIKIKTSYSEFLIGAIKNPYYPSVYGVGILGDKYKSHIDKKELKEYRAWKHMLRRCFDEKYKIKRPTYEDVYCCDEWLYYYVFYEWLHKQENFDSWLINDGWALDKDVLVKGNKLYSPDTCCLIPTNINSLFTKRDSVRGDLPIGVSKSHNKFRFRCSNPITKQRHDMTFNTLEEAFKTYKQYKENIIKQVAQEEFDKGNITQKCYEAMIRYEVEITD